MTGEGQGKSPKNHTLDRRVGCLEDRFFDLRSRNIDWWFRFISMLFGFFAIFVGLIGYLSYSELGDLRDEAIGKVNEIRDMNERSKHQ